MRMVCIKYALFCVLLLLRQLFFETKYSQALFPASLQPKLVKPLLYAFMGCLFFPQEDLLYLPRNQQKIEKNLPGPHSPHPAPHAFLLVLKPCVEMGTCFLFFFLGSNNPSHLFDMRFIKPNVIN